MELAGYKACICEGSAENAIMDILLDNDLLIFTKKEMLEEEVIRCRDGKRFEEKYLRKGLDIVFVDPDNGMLVKSVGKRSVKSIKYTFYEEVSDYIEQNQSVLIYSHRSRKHEEVYFHELCEKLGKISGVSESKILKIVFPRCSIRDYLAVPASKEHYEKLNAAFSGMVQGIWGQLGVCRIPRGGDYNG